MEIYCASFLGKPERTFLHKKSSGGHKARGAGGGKAFSGTAIKKKNAAFLRKPPLYYAKQAMDNSTAKSAYDYFAILYLH